MAISRLVAPRRLHFRLAVKEQKEKRSPGSEAAAAFRGHRMQGCDPQRRSAAHPGRRSILVQWLRCHTPSAGGLGSILSQGARSHMPQLRILRSATKTWCSQMNKHEFFLYLYFDFLLPLDLWVLPFGLIKPETRE